LVWIVVSNYVQLLFIWYLEQKSGRILEMQWNHSEMSMAYNSIYYNEKKILVPNFSILCIWKNLIKWGRFSGVFMMSNSKPAATYCVNCNTSLLPKSFIAWGYKSYPAERRKMSEIRNLRDICLSREFMHLRCRSA
jgi:hypothetical protein